MKKKDKCCTPKGQVPRYVDCIGCDKKPIETMSNQTAVEWLESQINLGLSERGLISAFKKAKAMEKEQMKEAALDNVTTNEKLRKIFEIQFEDFYNETYGGTK